MSRGLRSWTFVAVIVEWVKSWYRNYVDNTIKNRTLIIQSAILY